MIDAAPHLFDTDSLLAVGVQAPLDLAIDETATAERWQAPAQAPRPIPGQTTITEG